MSKINDAHKRLLKEKFEDAVNHYLLALLNMWEWDGYYGYFIGGEVGGIYAYADSYFISFDDMRYIVDNNVPRETFWEWQEYCVQADEFNLTVPNLSSWCKGCPRASKEALEHLRELKQQLDDAAREVQSKF